MLEEFHHLFDVDRAKVMTKASQWLKALIVNTGLPVVVCGMPEAEYVRSAEHTERRFKQRLTRRQKRPRPGTPGRGVAVSGACAASHSVWVSAPLDRQLPVR